MTTIPLGSESRQRFSIIVYGRRLSLLIYWHPSSESWFADIAVEQTSLVSGRRISLDADLLIHANSDAYLGRIKCIGLANSSVDPDRNAWGKTHQLVHDV